MFTLLAKLVRKLTRKERNALADKLVSLAKEETPDSKPDGDGQDGSDSGKSTNDIVICNATPLFTGGSCYSYAVPYLMDLALKRGSFCGIIIRDEQSGNHKIIVGQYEIETYHDDTSITLYMQGYGSSTPSITNFKITRLTEGWLTAFRQREQEIIYTPESVPIA